MIKSSIPKMGGAWFNPTDGAFRLMTTRGTWLESTGPDLGLPQGILEALPKAAYAYQAEPIMRAYAKGLLRLRLTQEGRVLEIHGAQNTVSAEVAFRAVASILEVLGLSRGTARYDRYEADIQDLRFGTIAPMDRYQPETEPEPPFPWITPTVEIFGPLPLTGTFPLLIDGKPGIGEILHRSQRDMAVRLLEPEPSHVKATHIPYFAIGHMKFTDARGDGVVRSRIRELCGLLRNRAALVACIRETYRQQHEAQRLIQVPEHYGDAHFKTWQAELRRTLQAGAIDNPTYQRELDRVRQSHKDYETALHRLEAPLTFSLPKQALGHREALMAWLEADLASPFRPPSGDAPAQEAPQP